MDTSLLAVDATPKTRHYGLILLFRDVEIGLNLGAGHARSESLDDQTHLIIVGESNLDSLQLLGRRGDTFTVGKT